MDTYISYMPAYTPLRYLYLALGDSSPEIFAWNLQRYKFQRFCDIDRRWVLSAPV